MTPASLIIMQMMMKSSFNLAGQEGVITIPAVISYDKIDEEDLFEDSVAGYTATLESGDIVTFYCFNAKNKS